MTFDPTKPPHQTRNGREARIICADLKHPEYQIAAVIIDENGDEEVESYTAGGLLISGEPGGAWDLINVPDKRVLEGWVNVYGDREIHSTCWPTKEMAETNARAGRIACVHVRQEYEVGS